MKKNFSLDEIAEYYTNIHNLASLKRQHGENTELYGEVNIYTKTLDFIKNNIILDRENIDRGWNIEELLISKATIIKVYEATEEYHTGVQFRNEDLSMSIQDCDEYDYERLKKFYHVNNADDFTGKNLISIYVSQNEPYLIGVMPVRETEK